MNIYKYYFSSHIRVLYVSNLTFDIQHRNHHQIAIKNTLLSTPPFPRPHLSSWQASASRADTGDNVTRASSSSVRHNGSSSSNDSLGELTAESLAVSQLIRRAKGSEAVVSIASLSALGECLGSLGDECTTLDGVDEDVARLEVWVVRPGSGVLHDTATWDHVVLGVDVDVGNFADVGTLAVGWDRGDIVDAETGSVVGLVDVVTDNVLVVIDGVSGSLVDTGLLGCLERGDIPNVGDWVSISGWATTVGLISLIIQDDVLLPLLVEDFTLVSVVSSSVCGTGDDLDVGLVSNVEDGESIFVVTIALQRG